MPPTGGSIQRLTAQIAWLSAALVCAACAPSPEAPTELDALTRFFFSAWDGPEQDLALGIDNLGALLEPTDLAGPIADRSWDVQPLTEPEVTTATQPQRDLSNLTAVSLAAASAWPVADHLRLNLLPDQTPFDRNAASYVRVFLDSTDPACLANGTCTRLATRNDIRRDNLVLRVGFELFKDFRTVSLNDGQTALLARSYYNQSWEGDAGSTTLWQTYGIELWMPGATSDTSVRYQAIWSDADVRGVSDEAVVLTLRNGADGVWAATDAYLQDGG